MREKVLERLRPALRAVRRHPLIAFWANELKSDELLSRWAERIYDCLAPGVPEKFPTPDILADKLRWTHNLRHCGVYIKVGLPKRPGLPILIYIGSATGSKLSQPSLMGRHRTHVKKMEDRSQ